MFALIAAAALVAAGNPPAASDETRAAYQAEQAHAGRSPADQVRLAYWCEAHGMTAERARHLALAVLADPNNAAARGLLGLVARQDRWLRPAAVADQVKADASLAATLAEYDHKRQQTPYTADGQWNLAQWADEHGLPAQAKAHYTAVIRLDPKRELAWKKLGYKRHEGRWTTDAEIAAHQADTEAQKAADQKWKPLLEKWKAQAGKRGQQAEAEANLATVTDPRALPSIGRVFGNSEADAKRLIGLLGQIDTPAASRVLASIALADPAAESRRLAIELLRRRDPREYANWLIPFFQKPIQYEVRPVNGPGQPGVLFIVGEKTNLKRLYEPRSFFQPYDQITLDRFGQPVINRHMLTTQTIGDGVPFHPEYTTGYGTSYEDSYSASSSIIGNLTRTASPKLLEFYRTHPFASPEDVPKSISRDDPSIWNGWKDMNGSPFDTIHPVDTTFEAIKILANQVEANQKAAQNKTQPVPVQLPADFAGGAFQPGNFHPRDSRVDTSEQYRLDQVMAANAQSARVSQQQLSTDIKLLDSKNAAIRAMNDHVQSILTQVTGENLPASRDSWERWYVNLLGFAFVANQTPQTPTIVEIVPSDYQPEVAPSNIIHQGVYASGISCFAAGTMVQALGGPQAIETIKVGDLVLTQSTSTGALGYHPVLVTHHNPPASTFRIKLDADTIVASQFHRFWVARRGWVMARDLKVGDPIRTLGGVVPVESIEAGPVQLVYNLDIADDANFFAGEAEALVHDNTLPDPRLVPFDLPVDRAKEVAVR